MRKEGEGDKEEGKDGGKYNADLVGSIVSIVVRTVF